MNNVNLTSLQDEIFPEVRPHEGTGYRLRVTGLFSVNTAAERVAQPGPDSSDVDGIVGCRPPAIVRVVVMRAWIFVNHQSFGAIDFIVIPPIGIQ